MDIVYIVDIVEIVNNLNIGNIAVTVEIEDIVGSAEIVNIGYCG